MQEASNWLNGLKSGFYELAAAMVSYLPNLLAALALLIGGWMIAKLARTVSTRLAGGLNRVLENVAPSGVLATVRISNKVAGLIGTGVFWLVMFIFVTAAADAAELKIFSVWLENIVAYLPNLLGGGFLIFFGYLLSIAVRDIVTTTLGTLSVRQNSFIGAAAQWSTFLTAIVVGIEQIGIDTTFLIVVIAVITGALVSGLALAFGLGAKPLTTNLMGTHYLRGQYSVGQKIKVGDIEGQILEFTATGMNLDTTSGVCAVPGATYFNDIIVLRNEDDDHG